MERGALVVEHNIVSPRNADQKGQPGRAEQRQQGIHIVLIRFGVIGVANVAADGQPHQLAAEVIFQPGADNLLTIVQILRADKAHHRIDQQRLKMAGDGIGPGFAGLLPYLKTLGLSLAPVVLAHQSRVALGDDIGETLKARAVAILIGERPGLSSPDSLGVYLTWQPHRQRLESERNCISNIRPEGLSFDAAAFKLAWLLEQAFLRRLTGVRLKDESDNPALHGKIKPLSQLK